MGCCGSNSKEFNDRLDVVSHQVERKPWRNSQGYSQLEFVVTELGEIHVFFSGEGWDSAQLARIQRLGDQLTEDLHSALSLDLIKAGDNEAIQTLFRSAKQVDKFRATRASEIVDQKYRSLLKQLGKEQLAELEAAVALLDSPKGLVRCARKVLPCARKAGPYAKEIPEIAAELLRLCRSFGAQVMEYLPKSLEAGPKDSVEIEDTASSLDSICRDAASAAGIKWENIEDQVRKLRSEVVAEKVATKLDELEAELGGGCKPAVKILDYIMAYLEKLTPDADHKARLQSAIKQLRVAVQAAFDEGTKSGSTRAMDDMVAAAKILDAHREKLGVTEEPMSREMEKMKTRLGLDELFRSASKNLDSQKDTLHTMFVETEANVNDLKKREKLAEPGEGARWKFSMGRGGFKNYGDEQCEEVEKLYQEWVAAGKPSDVNGRRSEISIQVAAGRGRAHSTTSGFRRKRCKYGEKCYQKNPEHRREFCHPNDADWNPVIAPPSTSRDSELREERFSLDFGMMTQVNLSKGRGMRSIKREEGRTKGEMATHVYFGKVIDFVKEANEILEKAVSDMHVLGETERASMQKQVDELVMTLKPVLMEFLGVTVLVKNWKISDEVMALMGIHAEALRLDDSLKELKLKEVLELLAKSYTWTWSPDKPSGWGLVRQLCKRQEKGKPRMLLQCRLALAQTKLDRATDMRRYAYMRCQGLLSEYERDEAFEARFREQAAAVLHEGLAQAAERGGEARTVADILRRANGWRCNIEPLLETAGQFTLKQVRSAAQSKLQPLARLIEVLKIAEDIGKDAGQRPVESFADFKPLIPLIAGKIFATVQQHVQAKESSSKMAAVVRQAVEIRYKIHPRSAAGMLDSELWKLLEPWYRSLILSGEGDDLAGEWAVAYCEQLGIAVPEWMMGKDQAEALRKLQDALSGGNEQLLREAVVFAKMADYKSDASLQQSYDEALEKLRKLKRLPSGWEVTDLVGEDATAKMFKKVDLEDKGLKKLFQKLFDETNTGVLTRDRAARGGTGAMPRGYRVQKIISVMNAESWGSYLSSVDRIASHCKLFPGAAPLPPGTWDDWSGPIMTAKHGEPLMKGAHLPPLNTDANEFLMLHGTKAEAADSIAQNHFDMAFACKTGLFGAGLYFAESSSKSDEYVKGDTRGWFPMILCRVTLGRINYVPHKDPTTDPGRDALEGSCLRGDYNSVLGDRIKSRGTYREFVVYDHFQVYPHFIVWYTRV
eukprot:TRINITY_DN23579_c0_g1_i1.p1 TRINITY_DN23579_c0_g1~~TRINITY_DN23579_c0_g1_i1.p1  ORF type:complete len:1230 (+),score=249.26 TRINITY_DN23579_c0_g1_i1:30-3719(+)